MDNKDQKPINLRTWRTRQRELQRDHKSWRKRHLFHEPSNERWYGAYKKDSREQKRL